MERADRLIFCERCTHRDFSSKTGLICGLTMEHASFEGTCPDFNLDAQVIKIEANKTQNTRSNATDYTIPLILVTILWFVLGFYAFGNSFFLPGIIIFILFFAIERFTRNGRKKRRIAKNKSVL